MEDLKKIQSQIAELQKQAEDIQRKQKGAAIKEVKEKIAAFGITARELGFTSLDSGSSRSVSVKYRKGDNTWSGRGRKPRWVEDHLSAGGTLNDLAV